MSISKYPSKLTLAQDVSRDSTVLVYLTDAFPAISESVWLQRMADGKVHWADGTRISPRSLCRPQQAVYYYREVESEPVIPFQASIVFQDDHLLVAYKPHFLPVTPGGIYVNECLQNRLRASTGIDALTALHRLDRETAGLVMFSVNPLTRARYHQLFADRTIEKVYHAVAEVDPAAALVGQSWQVHNRLVRSVPRFTMQVVEGNVNARSSIRCVQKKGHLGLFELKPITGKTHQLRLHMQSLGWPILHDRFYPRLLPKAADQWHQPLQLLAKKLAFIDPVTHEQRYFTCDKSLSLEPD